MVTLVQTSVDETIYDEAMPVLEAMGITLSDAVQLMLVRIAEEKRLPFEGVVPVSMGDPNAETVAAIEAARRGELQAFDSIDALMADLNADD